MGEVLPMPDARRTRLKELEEVISSGWAEVVRVGRALMEIRDEGLYKEVGAITFKHYCKSRWALSESYAYQHIDAAQIEAATSAIAEATPITTEAVSRELAPLLRDGGEQRVAEAWTKVSEKYRGQRPPTAREVHHVLVSEGYRPKIGQASGGPTNLRILLGQFGDKLVAAEKRWEWFLRRDLHDKAPTASVRKLAVAYAERLEALAHELREVAGRE